MNKEAELLHFRTQVIKPYVTEVMNRLEYEENLPKKLCAYCRRYRPLAQFFQYKQKNQIVYSTYCRDCLHKTAPKYTKK